ncbi:MAG: glycosyltransferase family 4 protein [Rhodoglobus sp.]
MKGVIVMPYLERAALALAEAPGVTAPSVIVPEELESRLPPGASIEKVIRNGLPRLSRRIANIRLDRRKPTLNGMHVGKLIFSTVVTRASFDGSDYLIGFPGASLSLFERAGPKTIKVLHAVDAHPQMHNEALLQTYSRQVVAAELYPRWLVKVIERELRLADLVLVPSRLVYQQMRDRGVPAEKLVLEPYGVDFSQFVNPSKSEEKTLPLVVYVGQMSRRKAIGHLLEAVRGLPISLTMVGNAFAQELTTNLPTNVMWLPPMDHDALARLFGTADAFVIPTLEDACSLSALEAAASGLPVITTDRNGAREILPSEYTVVVSSGDIGALRDAIRGVSALSAESRDLVAASARTGSGMRSWNDYSASVLQRIQAKVESS